MNNIIEDVRAKPPQHLSISKEESLPAVAPMMNQQWHFSTPPAGRELQLLTICGICVLGNWCGKVGQYFTAWAPLIAQDEPSFTNLH